MLKEILRREDKPVAFAELLEDAANLVLDVSEEISREVVASRRGSTSAMICLREESS